MAYYDGVVACSVVDECAVIADASVVFLSSLSQGVDDSCVFSTSGPCLFNYFPNAIVMDTGWPKESTPGTGETVNVTSVAILVDGVWRQAQSQQLAADGNWHSQ